MAATEPLFGVENYVEEEQADGGEDDVVAEEELDPEDGVAVAGEDGASGEDHGQQGGHEDGEEDEREEEFAVAAADGEGSEEGSVGDQGPGAEREDEQQLPGLALNAEVVEDKEDRGQDQLNDRDEEEVGEHFGQEEVRARGGGHALGIENLVADFAGPGLVEGAHGGE